MLELVTGTLMKEMDERTSAHFRVPPVVLMEQAAIGFVDRLLRLYPKPGRILILCGNGNNGGDGIACARIFNQRGISAAVYLPAGGEKSALCALQWEIYRAYGYPVAADCDDPDRWDMVVDALFGTGLSRELRDPYRSLIAAVNQWRARRIALDIASGLSTSDGQILGDCFCASDTITFSFGKLGSFLYPGAACSGHVHIVPIGITKESIPAGSRRVRAYEREDLYRLPKRMADSHKGTYGKLLVIAGSAEMAGAAVFAGKAAYRMGCGLVKIMTPEENRAVILGHLPEAVLELYRQKPEKEKLVEALVWADAVVLGPGIGLGDAARAMTEQVLSGHSTPLLLDADALTIVAGSPELLQRKGAPARIITPHMGEFGRLTGKKPPKIREKFLEITEEYAKKTGCITVCKDSRTLTSVPVENGEVLSYLNLSGNSGMATAGSGDVLAGVIGGLLAQRVLPETAAPLGVYVHGLAGDAAAEALGEAAVTATDILDYLPRVLKGVRADVRDETSAGRD